MWVLSAWNLLKIIWSGLFNWLCLQYKLQSWEGMSTVLPEASIFRVYFDMPESPGAVWSLLFCLSKVNFLLNKHMQHRACTLALTSPMILWYQVSCSCDALNTQEHPNPWFVFTWNSVWIRLGELPENLKIYEVFVQNKTVKILFCELINK